MTSNENGAGTLKLPEEPSNRWSAASSSAQYEDARTLRNTLESDFDYMAEVKRAGNAGTADAADPERTESGGSASLDKEREVTTKDEAPAPATGAGHDDFPDGGLRAWLVVLGVRRLLPSCRGDNS